MLCWPGMKLALRMFPHFKGLTLFHLHTWDREVLILLILEDEENEPEVK